MPTDIPPPTEEMEHPHLIIDPARLKPETLAQLAREFILRECAQDMNVDSDADATVPAAVARIKRGEFLITFDARNESIGLVEKKQMGSPHGNKLHRL